MAEALETLSPEDQTRLHKLILLRADQGGAIPPEAAMPQLAPNTPITPQGSAQVSPDAAAQPYNQQAATYNQQAAGLQQQAAQPRPQPQNGQERMVAALRAAMENMGQLGAPGGYYGQEEQRQQEFDRQNAARLAQAQELRALAGNQQLLAQGASKEAGTQNYQNQDIAQKNQERATQLAREQTQADVAAENERFRRNQPVKLTPGEVLVPPGGGAPIASGAEKETNLQHTVLMVGGKPEVWALDPKTGTPTHKIGDAQPQQAGANLQVVQGTDANGNPIFNVVNKSGATSVPVKQDGGASLPTNAKGDANVKNTAKEDEEYKTSMASVHAMENSAKLKTYAGDQALGDQFFNVIKPGSGARMNQAQIGRLMTPGPLKDKLLVWAQKLDQGQPLDDAARAALIDAAHAVVEAKPHSGASAAPGSGANVVHYDNQGNRIP